MAMTATMAMMVTVGTMMPNSDNAASGNEGNKDTKQLQQQQRQQMTMGIINPAEAITVGDVVVPRMPPSRQQPCRNDAFVIIQLSPTGLTLRRNT
jgi:hypothetical protein